MFFFLHNFSNDDFPMFVSMLDHKDLMFQDSTVRLVRVPNSKQNYKDYLETEFLRAMERMENIDCVTAGASRRACANSVILLCILTVFTALRYYVTL